VKDREINQARAGQNKSGSNSQDLAQTAAMESSSIWKGLALGAIGSAISEVGKLILM
jgi:hypothetical protein